MEPSDSVIDLSKACTEIDQVVGRTGRSELGHDNSQESKGAPNELRVT